MKRLSFIVCLLIGISAYSISDTLHIYPSKYYGKGEPLQTVILEAYGLDTIYKGTKFRFQEKFELEEYSCTFTVLSFSPELYPDYTTIVVLIEHTEYGFICANDLAFHYELEGTMEETQNCWIYDWDDDGDLDILMMSFLTDYELPMEDAPNITGLDGSLLVFENGKFNYHYLPNDIPVSFGIIE